MVRSVLPESSNVNHGQTTSKTFSILSTYNLTVKIMAITKRNVSSIDASV
jgi:hypothetical protein